MIVLVGGGLASARAAETLRSEGYDGRITIVGDELVLPYHRPPLSKSSLGDSDDSYVLPMDFYRTHDIELRLARNAARLDAVAREIVLDRDERLAFEQLLIATGAAPRRPPLPGVNLGNVMTYRFAEDAALLRERLGAAPRVVIVGGGLLGLELAASIRTLGHPVTVFEAAPWPLGRLLHGPEVGASIVALHRDHGVDIRTRAAVRGFVGVDRVDAVELLSGERIPCDLAILALGVQPTTEWLAGSGLRIDDGVLVDAGMRTHVPGIFAAGDVARAYHPLYGEHVRVEQYGHSASQAVVAARNMLGRDEVMKAAPSAGSEQFGARIQVIGRLRGGEDAVILGNPAARRFCVAFFAEGRLRAAFAMNRPRDVASARKLIEAASPVDREAMAQFQQIYA